MNSSVASVVRLDLCISCGACRFICPVDAIRMKLDSLSGLHKPVVGQDCTDCGQCLEVCFGANDDFVPSMTIIDNLISGLGTEVVCFSGNAANENLRTNGSSGGIATALLSFFLNENLIDAAIVVRNVPNQPGLAESYLARNSDELLASVTSKYCPVSFNRALKQLKDGERYAMVGLPCHFFAVDKLVEKKALRGSIDYRIGLLCGGIPNRNGTRYVIENQGVSFRDITKLTYRGGGWPGRMLMKTDKKSTEVPYMKYWLNISPWFTLRRCMACLSSFNTRADVVLGDLWLPEIMQKDRLGSSLILTRSRLGNQVVSSAKGKGYMEVRRIDKSTMLKSQQSLLATVRSRRTNFQIQGKQYPQEHPEIIKTIERINQSVKRCERYIISRGGRFLASDSRRWIFLRYYTTLLRLLMKLGIPV